jgi:uncharacterized membrane protein
MVGPRKRFKLADTAQQVVGGFLLAGPFIVTEEVWVLAANMTALHAVFTAGIVFTIGYGALYRADDDRDPDRETDIGGVPLRFVSLMIVSFGSVLVLALAFTAPSTFAPGILEAEGVDPTDVAVAATTVKAVAVGAIFSVVGAATADSVF